MKVVLVEDRPETIEAFEALLQRDARFELRWTFNDLTKAVAEIPKLAPDVVLLDIIFPASSGIEALKALRRELNETPIVMLTAYEDNALLFDSLLAGATGYLLKTDPPEALLEELGMILQGGAPISRAIARKVLGFFHKLGGEFATQDDDICLSGREHQILDLTARGHSAKQIADRLKISEFTVRTHLKRIYRKLHVHSSAGAVAKFIRRKSILQRFLD